MRHLQEISRSLSVSQRHDDGERSEVIAVYTQRKLEESVGLELTRGASST